MIHINNTLLIVTAICVKGDDNRSFTFMLFVAPGLRTLVFLLLKSLLGYASFNDLLVGLLG
jgi:hypothetical protein